MSMFKYKHVLFGDGFAISAICKLCSELKLLFLKAEFFNEWTILVISNSFAFEFSFFFNIEMIFMLEFDIIKACFEKFSLKAPLHYGFFSHKKAFFQNYLRESNFLQDLNFGI